MQKHLLNYPSVLSYHPTWDICDSTKLKTFMTCPRKYFYQYVLGWDLDVPNIHLVFGEAWHLAMAHMLTNGYSPETVSEAYDLFRGKYLQHFREADEESNAPKNLENSMRALIEYAQTYRTETYEVVRDKDGNPWTEIAGTVPVGEDRVLHFRTDAVMKDGEQYFVMEHKTTTYLSSAWQEQWALSVQVGAYLHVLCCVFDPAQVWGVRINGMIFRNPPKMKKDGTPYANASKGNECVRVPIRKTTEMMQQWLEIVNHWLTEIDMEFHKLSCSSEQQDVLNAFPMNTESCITYNQVCKFHDFCVNWPNPLKRCSQVPIGFIEKRWDPGEKEVEAKKIFRL